MEEFFMAAVSPNYEQIVDVMKRIETIRNPKERIAFCRSVLKWKIEDGDQRGALYAILARSFRHVNEFEKGLQAATQGLYCRVAPNTRDNLYYEKIVALCKTENYQKAKSAAQKAIRQTGSENMRLDFSLCLVTSHTSLSEFNKAEKAASAALATQVEIQGVNDLLRMHLITSFISQEKYKEVIEKSDLFLALVKDVDFLVQIYQMRGEAFFQLKKYKKAEGAFIKGVQLKSKDPKINADLLLTYSRCLFALNRGEAVQNAFQSMRLAK